MDVLLAHGYFLAEDARERLIMKPYAPLGLLYVSSHLKARGFEVGVFDSTFRRFEEFTDRLDRDRPGVVGLYVTLMTKRSVLRMVEACGRRGIAVVLGGPEPANYLDEYLAHGADVIVVGEGEHTMEELLPRLRAGQRAQDLGDVPGIAFRGADGSLVRTPARALIRDLDAQPLPDRDAIDVGAYLQAWRSRHGMGSISLTTARGCPYTCRWCSRSVYGETHRRRSPARVAEEVDEVVGRWHPDMLWYVDDVFTIHPGWIASFADEMARRGLRVPFECISRAERITPAVAESLERLGCFRMWIGSESGSPRVLKAMDRRMTVEEVRRATVLLQGRGIQVGLFIMVGYEGEEEGDLQATVDHLKVTRPDTFLTTVAYPIKGTPYHDAVAGRLRPDGAWADRTDRDLVIRGRRPPLFYRFARQWMEAEVARDRHWRAGRWVRAARAATAAGAGRLGMTLAGGLRER